jgi:hypothetical protein
MGPSQKGAPIAKGDPSLETLLINLKAASRYPDNSLEYLKELFIDAEKIVEKYMRIGQSNFDQ